MVPLALRVDVGDGLALAALVFAPPGEPAYAPLLMCSHGGTLTKHYWHLDGHAGYSFGEHMADRGFIVVTFDQLGTGESDVPGDLEQLTSVAVASASHALAERVTERLASGTLVDGLRPLSPTRRIGAGHSFGGWMTIRQQGRFRTFDAVAILGTTLLELQFSRALAARRAELRTLVEPLAGFEPEEAEQRLYRELGATPPSTVEYGDEVLRIFHWEDVPRDVVDADTAQATQRVGAVTCATMVPDAFAADAAAIDVPVFLGFGERDISPEPRAEPARYRGSTDITLHVLPRSAHCHNYASTRTAQWDRVAAWIGLW